MSRVPTIQPQDLPRYRWRSTGSDGGAQAEGPAGRALAVHQLGRKQNVYIGGSWVASVEGPGAYECAKEVAKALAIAEALGWKRPE